MTDEGDITVLLQAVSEGNGDALEQLVALVQERLRVMAAHRMRQEGEGHTLQPTALVNEAYIRMAGTSQRFENRAHFFGAAAEAMRRVLVDHARKLQAEKRGAGMERVTFADVHMPALEREEDLLALDEAIDALEEHDTRLADVVRLRYFVGLSIEEAAEAIGVSTATVKRDWTYARAWLRERIDHSD